MIIFKQFNFDAAHFLPNVPEGHKCKNVHGHTYRMTLFFEGEIDPHFGWVIDFADIKSGISPVIDLLDHTLLNDIEGLENPTCENIAVWIWDHIKPKIPLLSRIELFENLTSGAIYDGGIKTG